MCASIENLSKSLHTNDLIHNEDIKMHPSYYNAFNTIRVFETPLLNVPLGLRLLFTPSGFWLRYSQHSQADTDFNATDLELSYRFSIDRISIQGATLVDI